MIVSNKKYQSKLEDFIVKRKHLVWYVKNHKHLNEVSIVEAVLNYGDWDDFQDLIEVMGLKQVSAIFKKASKPDKFGRINYRPKTSYYFNLYFNQYA